MKRFHEGGADPLDNAEMNEAEQEGNPDMGELGQDNSDMDQTGNPEATQTGEHRGDVLIIDYYRAKQPVGDPEKDYQSTEGENYKKPAGVKQIEDAIVGAGYNPHFMHHKEAEAKARDKQDFMSQYDAAMVSGSDISWRKKQGEDGKEYMDPGPNDLHEHLVNQPKPVHFECGSFHAATHALGGTVRHSGEKNTGMQGDKWYNHTYGVDPENLGEKVDEMETFKHANQDYVDSWKKGNKEATQYHPGKTEEGKHEISGFLNRYVGV